MVGTYMAILQLFIIVIGAFWCICVLVAKYHATKPLKHKISLNDKKKGINELIAREI